MIVYVKIYDNTAKVQHYQCFFAPPQRFESLTACQKEKIPKSLKLRDFLYLSMVCGVFVPYIFHRNHTKINVDIHVLTCNFTSKFTTTLLCVFEDAYSFLDCHVFALAACGF
nr:MAG TPA: hypothetical protein [Caudoviricetes sp.]